jgi:hypothetical protein
LLNEFDYRYFGGVKNSGSDVTGEKGKEPQEAQEAQEKMLFLVPLVLLVVPSSSWVIK